MKFYLLSTSPLKDRLWFRDDADFQAAMNYVAVSVAVVQGVNVLAFILMSNHVHFVLECTWEKALEFITHFKRLYGAYFERRHGVHDLLRRNSVDIREVRIQDESLLRAIAYVMDNPVAANICFHPSNYPWGCGNVLFNPGKERGTALGQYSQNKRRVLLKSKSPVNLNWEIGRDGYVLPHSYMPVSFVESLFCSPRRLTYFITTSSKAKARLEKGAAPAFQDQLILAAVKSLCQSLFRCNGVSELPETDLSYLLKDLRRRFNSDVKQLARVLGMPYESVANLIDRA